MKFLLKKFIIFVIKNLLHILIEKIYIKYT